MELINNGSYEFFETKNEMWRKYEYIERAPDGSTWRYDIVIVEPQFVSVNPKNGGHRVLDGDGISHYIQPGWKHLRWKAIEGMPHFVK